jgi:hypothetical protein
MKLEKKKAYRAKTQEQFNKILEQAEKQGIRWSAGEKATEHREYWSRYEKRTLVCVGEDGLTFTTDEYGLCFGCEVVDFVEEPKVVQINPWCVRVDAPDFAAAQSQLDEWLNNMMKRTNEEIMEKMFSEKCYTVRVDGRDVTVITPDGKTATAHCHPDDEFDIAEGVRIALEKIERKNHKLTEKEWNVLNFLACMDCDTMYVNKGYCLGGERDGDTIIELSDASVEDLFDWLDDCESYDIDELMKLDVED